MKRELKSKWIKALRSGKYKQGKGRLKKNGKFCCLGVLRDVVNPKDRRGENGMLSPKQLDEFGLTDNKQNFLASRNDGLGMQNPDRLQWNFNQIADYIQANL